MYLYLLRVNLLAKLTNQSAHTNWALDYGTSVIYYFHAVNYSYKNCLVEMIQ